MSDEIQDLEIEALSDDDLEDVAGGLADDSCSSCCSCANCSNSAASKLEN